MKMFGLAGTHASGKDTIAELLVKKHGFYHVSTGDIFREEAMKRYGSIERPIIYKTANEIRNQQGYDAVSRIALERYSKVKHQYPRGLVVSGFRAIAEAQVIKEAGGVLIFTDAPADIRYERLRKRARVEEGKLSREEFDKREKAENGGVDPAFNILEIKNIADIVLVNDGDDMEAFKDEADKILGLST
jgi:dephospho-CoA kinase